MEQIILFGTGTFGKRSLKKMKSEGICPIYCVDNDQTKWGKSIEGIQILNPSMLRKDEFDAVVICVNDTIYDQIYVQLVEEYGIPAEKIRHWSYWLRNDFLSYYKKREYNNSDEIKSIVRYAEGKDRLCAFNYPFADCYVEEAKCYFDDSIGLYYSIYKGKKLYLSSKYKEKKQAETYVRGLMIEQDPKSPHRYLDKNFNFDGGCLLDAGTAEGNFALDVVEKADRLILVEGDESWNEALKKTFEPWREKVVIINKYLSDVEGERAVTIDSISKDYKIDFIKMDIEGAEVAALRGGHEFFCNTKKLKMAICAYHNLDDENKIRDVLSEFNFEVNAVPGLMVFPDNIFQSPRLVRGVLRVQR